MNTGERRWSTGKGASFVTRVGQAGGGGVQPQTQAAGPGARSHAVAVLLDPDGAIVTRLDSLVCGFPAYAVVLPKENRLQIAFPLPAVSETDCAQRLRPHSPHGNDSGWRRTLGPGQSAIERPHAGQATVYQLQEHGDFRPLIIVG
jgi:hypothetical protein